MGRFIESTSLSSQSAIKNEKSKLELHIVLQLIIDLQKNCCELRVSWGISLLKKRWGNVLGLVNK